MSIDVTISWHISKNFANLLCMPKNAAKVILFCQIDTTGIVCYSLKIPIFAAGNNNVSMCPCANMPIGCAMAIHCMVIGTLAY